MHAACGRSIARLVRPLLFPGGVRSKPWICLFALLAIASCRIETSYVPRTPNALALGMSNGEPAVYKNGVLTKVTNAPDSVVACSVPAAADAREAAARYASYNTNTRIGAIFNALGAFAPPMLAVGLFFTSRAAHHQQKSYVHIVDAINRHNDEIGCVPQ